MSRFSNYCSANIARIYDKMRAPMGVNVIAGLMHVHCHKLLKDIHVLDAGCGTGQQAKALLDLGIGKLTLLDASTEMLAVANEKLDQVFKDKKIDAIVKATLPNLPFADKTFDAVLFNQSLHHLNHFADCGTYPGFERVLAGTHRILKENGVLLIMTTLPSTIRESMWFLQAHTGIREKIAKACMPMELYAPLFHKHAFKCASALNVLTAADESFFNDYFDPEIPLNVEWRQAFGCFDIATDKEIKEMEGFLLDKKQKGTLEKFMQHNDHTQERGQGTLFTCIAETRK